jgi:hypothetical protein
MFHHVCYLSIRAFKLEWNASFIWVMKFAEMYFTWRVVQFKNTLNALIRVTLIPFSPIFHFPRDIFSSCCVVYGLWMHNVWFTEKWFATLSYSSLWCSFVKFDFDNILKYLISLFPTPFKIFLAVIFVFPLFALLNFLSNAFVS